MPRPRLSEEQKKANRKESVRKYTLKQAATGNKKSLNITGKAYARFEEFRSKDIEQTQVKITQAEFLNKLLDLYEKYQANLNK